MTNPQNVTQNETVTFNTNLTLAEIENRLSGLDNFDVKEKSEDELVVNVGTAFSTGKNDQFFATSFRELQTALSG